MPDFLLLLLLVFFFWASCCANKNFPCMWCAFSSFVEARHITWCVTFVGGERRLISKSTLPTTTHTHTLTLNTIATIHTLTQIQAVPYAALHLKQFHFHRNMNGVAGSVVGPLVTIVHARTHAPSHAFIQFEFSFLISIHFSS